MNKVDRRLNYAVLTNADPAVMSPSGTKFAIAPVWGWDHATRKHRWLYMEKVVWFRPLGLYNEYFTYVGSENEFHDKHGRYSWQEETH